MEVLPISHQSTIQDHESNATTGVETPTTQLPRSDSPTSSECVNNSDEMRGFKVFQSAAQITCFVVLLVAVVISMLTRSTALTPLAVYAALELFVLIIAVIHALKPSIRMLIIFMLFTLVTSVSAIVSALVVTVSDEGKDCSRVFDFSPIERFRFFCFLLSKATISLFLSLVAVAGSSTPATSSSSKDSSPSNNEDNTQSDRCEEWSEKSEYVSKRWRKKEKKEKKEAKRSRQPRNHPVLKLCCICGEKNEYVYRWFGAVKRTCRDCKRLYQIAVSTIEKFWREDQKVFMESVQRLEINYNKNLALGSLCKNRTDLKPNSNVVFFDQQSETFFIGRTDEYVASGLNGNVYRCEAENGRILALKQVFEAHSFSRELLVLQSLKRSNFTTNPLYFDTKSEILGLKFISLPTLKSMENSFTTHSTAKVLYSLCQWLKRLHGLSTCHKDISLGNIFYEGDDSIEVCDFGNAMEDGELGYDEQFDVLCAIDVADRIQMKTEGRTHSDIGEFVRKENPNRTLTAELVLESIKRFLSMPSR